MNAFNKAIASLKILNLFSDDKKSATLLEGVDTISGYFDNTGRLVYDVDVNDAGGKSELFKMLMDKFVPQSSHDIFKAVAVLGENELPKCLVNANITPVSFRSTTDNNAIIRARIVFDGGKYSSELEDILKSAPLLAQALKLIGKI